jgi:hypothetical protein
MGDGTILCAAAIFLLAVTVIGHGMWLVAAWLLRGMFSDTDSPPEAPPPLIQPPRSLSDDLRVTAEQVKRLAQRGSLSPQQSAELLAILDSELARLAILHLPVGSKLLPENRQQPAHHAQAGPSLAPVNVDAEVVDAILVEPPSALAPQAAAAAALQPVHPLDRPTLPPPLPAPSLPQRSLADMLQGFMEESNIRWGEILAAMLMVLCSVGLVISLRATLQNIPYFPAILFTLFTVSFHGAGMYTLHRWNLQAVSRVILIISLLLVPLTICGAVVLQQARPATDPIFLAALAAGIGIFTWVCYSASRELVGSAAWPLTIGVLFPSLSQVLIERLHLAGADLWQLNLAAAVPLAGFLVAAGSQIARARLWKQLSKPRVIRILRILGTATFALLAPLVLIMLQAAPRWMAIARLSPALSLAAAAILALGLLIHLRTTSPRLAAWQTAGTAIVVLAAVLLLLLVAATWPQPELLLAVGLIDCAILAILGVAAGMPVLYVPSVACAAIATTIGLHLACGHFADREQLSLKIVQAAVMGRTSVALSVLACGAAAIGAWQLLKKRAAEALMLLVSAGGVAIVAIAIAIFSGFVVVPDWPQDKDWAAWILLGYAVAAILLPLPLGEGWGEGLLVEARKLVGPHPATSLPPSAIGRGIVGCGSLLLWAALVQALAFNGAIRGWLAALPSLIERPVLIATLIHGLITSVAALVTRRLQASAEQRSGTEYALRFDLTAQPLAIGAAISLLASTPFIIAVRGDQYAASATMALFAAVGWALLAAAERWAWAISALQAMLALAPALVIAGVWKARDGSPRWFLNEQHLLAQFMAASAATLIWSPARRLTLARGTLRRLLNPPWPAVDQLLLGIAAMGLPLVAILVVLPSIGLELSFEPYLRSASIATVAKLSDALAYGWIAVAVVLVALIVSLWERVSVAATIGLGIAAFAAVSLAAGHFDSSVAAASASRWTSAIYAILAGVAYILRDPLRNALKRVPTLRWRRFPPAAMVWFCAQPLLLGGRAILLLTIIAVSQHASGVALGGPVPNSLFDAMGPTISYATPLMALVAVLLGYAVRERQTYFALGGAAVSQLAVNLAYLLHVNSSQPPEVRAIIWLQWNSVAAGAYALVWFGLAPWMKPKVLGTLRVPSVASNDSRSEPAMDTWFIPVGLAAATAAALCIWSAWAIFHSPAFPPAELSLLGSWLSYLAIALLTIAVLLRSAREVELDYLGGGATLFAAALVPLIASTLNRFDSGAQWLAYHTLEVGWLAVGALGCALLLLRRLSARLATIAPHHLAVAIITGLVVALAIRGNQTDPAQPWWSLGSAVGACAFATLLGVSQRSQPYAYASTAFAGLAVPLFWTAPATWPWISLLWKPADLAYRVGIEFIFIAVVCMAGFWLRVEVRSQRSYGSSFDVRPWIPRIHAIIAAAVLPQLLLRLVLALSGVTALSGYGPSVVMASLALGGLFAGSLWDRRAVWMLPAAYLWLAATFCLAIGLASPWLPHFEHRLTALILATAIEVALTGQLWRHGALLSSIGSRLGVPDPIGGLVRTEKWLVPLNLLISAGICGIALLLVLTFSELPTRVAAAWGPAIVAWGIACLAQERRRNAFQLNSLLVAGLTGVYLAWAQLPPSFAEAVWLTRVFRLLMVLAALTFIYGLALPRLLLTTGSWNAATRKAGYVCAVLALTTFVITLGLEVALFEPGVGAPVDNLQVAAIAVVLLAMIAGLISLAVLPGRDPLVLSERGRQAYIYAAEVTAALLFAHLYVCKPLWFDGILRPYWPFIVMGVSFLGVGAAELFERFKIRVLAEPLSRTGALLPILPVLGMWVVAAQADYALVLLIVGILYMALSYARKSWAAGVAAVVAGNGALWSLLSDKDLTLLANPQLWLIPPALSVLVAAQLNRQRLTAETLAAIRYAATLVIYVSSTSEIFIRGFGAGLIPPMVLLGLAVLGAMAGIALRVRAFLLLGSLFTFLALLTMIRHAAQSINNVWPWWVFGIALSVSMFILFGIFEKKKPEVMLLIGRLRQWDR